MELWKRFFPGGKNQNNQLNSSPRSEHIGHGPLIEIIDETVPGNILSDINRLVSISPHGGFGVLSQEGFAENPERQVQLAQFLIDHLQLKGRGPLLDVGYGSNLHIANTFVRNGIPAYGIDLGQSADGDKWKVPLIVEPTDDDVTLVEGDIAKIGMPGSALRTVKFGLILFNGSWTSGGNNFTVGGEVMEFKAHQEQPKAITRFMNEEKDRIIRETRDHIAPKGRIGVVSSRYANHGAGWDYQRLPEEKLTFIDLFDRFVRAGATKITIAGISQNGFDHMTGVAIDQIQEQPAAILPEVVQQVRNSMAGIASLPTEDVYSLFGDEPKFQRNLIRGLIDRNMDNSELNKVARIDAMFASFAK